MLAGESIIYFGPGPWDGLWRNRQQLMSRFAKKNRVIYVEPTVNWRKMAAGLKSKLHSKENKPTPRLRQIDTNLYVYNPATIPLFGRFPLDRISWSIWKALFKSALKELEFHSPIIWLSQPTMQRFISQFNEKLSVYHVVDDYSSYLGADKQKVEQVERSLLSRVDLAIVVSDNLFKKMVVGNKNTFKVANGVD